MLITYLNQQSGHFPMWAEYVAALNMRALKSTPATASHFFIGTSRMDITPWLGLMQFGLCYPKSLCSQ
jgi:hypothetical protein